MKGLTNNMNNFQKHKKELLKNKKIKEEYERLEVDFQVIDAIVKARKETHITQKELSEITGLSQSNISRIENGIESPSLRTLQILAKGFGKKLNISFK